MEEIEAICDRVAILDAGRVLRDGALTAAARRCCVVRAAERNLEQLFMQLTSRSLRD